MKATPTVISVAEHAGWANFVCVGAEGHVPAVIERRRAVTIGDGLPTMPYHHETLDMREDEANALIARVRRSIARHTSRALRQLATDLPRSRRVVALAIREPPFAALPDTVAIVRRSYLLQCAADGMMYQLAFCRAACDLGLDVHLCRRGQEVSHAAARLKVPPREIELFVNVAGRPLGPPWPEELRRAYAAGIAALAAHAPRLDLRIRTRKSLRLRR
jgi:hypothetical protein